MQNVLLLALVAGANILHIPIYAQHFTILFLGASIWYRNLVLDGFHRNSKRGQSIKIIKRPLNKNRSISYGQVSYPDCLHYLQRVPNWPQSVLHLEFGHDTYVENMRRDRTTDGRNILREFIVTVFIGCDMCDGMMYGCDVIAFDFLPQQKLQIANCKTVRH